MVESGSIVTRFAPSPTGHLHIGGARTALFCWAFAQKSRRHGKGGRFLIRIEDTDRLRSSEESARGILEDLAWLGIAWDDGPELKVQGPDQQREGASLAGLVQSVTGAVATIGGDERGVGPFFQAQRRHLYDFYIEKLVREGKAYPAFETPEELEVRRREAIARKETYRYDRAALEIPLTERMARMAAGEPHVVRFRMPDAPIHVRDEVLGDISIAAGETDDFVIRKQDGFPTYHFAVVIDDELMGITHVLRAQEHLSNTPRHVALQQALTHEDGRRFRTPVYAHMPLIFNMDGSKMSKRDKDKAVRKACREKGIRQIPRELAERLFAAGTPASLLSSEQFERWLSESDRQLPLEALQVIADYLQVDVPEVDVHDFRRAGYLPEAITNFIALLGWSPGFKDGEGKDIEKFDMNFLAEHFELSRIGRTNARFDRTKLLAFNADAITAMNDAEFTARWCAWLTDHDPGVLERLDAEQLAILARAVRPRCKTLRDGARVGRFALVEDHQIEYDSGAVKKHLQSGSPSGLELLREFRQRLAACPAWTPAALQALADAYVLEKNVGIGKLAQALRVALTGASVSPPLGETLAVLPPQSALARIDRSLREHV
jgi:glutamyl/glutaminyl-tRNA synthetase